MIGTNEAIQMGSANFNDRSQKVIPKLRALCHGSWAD